MRCHRNGHRTRGDFGDGEVKTCFCIASKTYTNKDRCEKNAVVLRLNSGFNNEKNSVFSFSSIISLFLHLLLLPYWKSKD